MNHQETALLLQGYVDGELDLKSTLEVEQHLTSCELCSGEYQNYLALHSALSAGSLYHRAPAALDKRIRASIRVANKPAPTPRRLHWGWPSLAAAIVAIAGIIILSLAVRLLLVPSNAVVDEVVSSHVRSMMGDHLTDVTSTDQHTVKPWFDGRLDFAPDVQDWASQGFPLVGGRLDYVDNRPVAALVYKRRLHTINLFIWPTSDATSNPQNWTRQGYHIIEWNQSGMTYWAISDLGMDELAQFAQLVRGTPPPTP